MKLLKRILVWTTLILMISFIFLPSVSLAATDPTMSFDFEFSAKGEKTVTAEVGELIDFQLELKRTDEGKAGHYTLYSMQDELILDSRYFAFIEGSQEVAAAFDFGIRFLEDGIRQRITVSRVVMGPSGARVPDELVLLSFQLKALTAIKDEPVISRNYKVNTRSGDTYISTGNDVIVTIKGPGPTHYAVIFEGGDETAWGMAPSVGGKAEGDQFTLPDNTFQREGYTFRGWHDGSRTYEAGDRYTMPGRMVVFTAQWEEKPPLTSPSGGVTRPSQSVPEQEPATTSPSTPQGNQTLTSSNEGNPSVNAGFGLIIDRKVKEERGITIAEVDEGVHLRGDNLKGLTFQVVKDGRKAQMELDTEEKEVLIKEMPDGSFEAWIDKDGDGIFDTPIARVAIGGMSAIWWLAVGLVVLLAAGFLIVFFARQRRERFS
ncbi:MAG: hypothetical protein WDA02_08235 [Saccharofermentanales bacterium]